MKLKMFGVDSFWSPHSLEKERFIDKSVSNKYIDK
jgi:hypothetical protein